MPKLTINDPIKYSIEYTKEDWLVIKRSISDKFNKEEEYCFGEYSKEELKRLITDSVCLTPILGIGKKSIVTFYKNYELLFSAELACNKEGYSDCIYYVRTKLEE